MRADNRFSFPVFRFSSIALPPRAGRRGGFTLVEVMVALIIISVALVTLLTNHARSTKHYAQAKAMTVCSLLARAKLADLYAGELPEAGEQSGAFEGNENYSWTLTVKETDLEDLREATLEVALAPPEGAVEDGPTMPGISITAYLAKLAEEEEEEEEGGEGAPQG